jgi:hypothetical protein
MSNRNLHKALRFVRRGWTVLPWHAEKASRCSCGDLECRNVGQHTLLEVAGRAVDKAEQERTEPTQSAESIADKAKAEHLAALDVQAFHWIARGREANRELGRIFNEIKSILKHGEWEPYFENTFRKHGIALRTAQDYMRLAGEPDRASHADPALFPPATDPQAQSINDATENARAAVVTANEQSPETSKSKNKTRVRRDGIYKLPLSMTGQDMTIADELRGSPNWPDAEMEIITFLQRLHIKYVTYPEAAPDAAQTGEALEEKADDEDPLAYA